MSSVWQSFGVVLVCVRAVACLYRPPSISVSLNEEKLCRSVPLEQTPLSASRLSLPHASSLFCATVLSPHAPVFGHWSLLYTTLSFFVCRNIEGNRLISFTIRHLWLFALFHACKEVHWALNFSWLCLNSVWSDICEPLLLPLSSLATYLHIMTHLNPPPGTKA